MLPIEYRSLPNSTSRTRLFDLELRAFQRSRDDLIMLSEIIHGLVLIETDALLRHADVRTQKGDTKLFLPRSTTNPKRSDSLAIVQSPLTTTFEDDIQCLTVFH